MDVDNDNQTKLEPFIKKLVISMPIPFRLNFSIVNRFAFKNLEHLSVSDLDIYIYESIHPNFFDVFSSIKYFSHINTYGKIEFYIKRLRCINYA
jgi:hypothetical protein